MTIAKILIVEDDVEIQIMLRSLLEGAGYGCDMEADGLRGLERALTEPYDAVVLDLGLPSLHGLDICRALKEKKPYLPVLMLTAQGEEADIVSGLEVGSDDYLTKPFRPKELLARLRARLRETTRQKLESLARSSGSSERPNEMLTIGEIRIDFEKMRAFRGDSLLDLTAREFEVLALLASYPGRPFTREELLREVWHFEAEDYSVTVSVFFSRLRRKVEVDPERPRYILTVRGVGYRFVEPQELAQAPEK